MPIDIQALGIDQLSVGVRLQLIELIWDNLPDQVNAEDLPPWHLAELAKRRAESETSPGTGRPWREVLDQLGTKS